jgi:hypothetical protein
MASVGTVNKTYVSAISMLDQRDILESVLDIHNDAELTDLMSLSGRYKEAKMGTYHNYVNEGLYLLIDTTGATVTGSGTATVNTKATAATSGYVKKNHLIIFPNKKVGIVTSVTYDSVGGDTFTVKSIDGTNLTHTAGQKLAPFSNAYGEKSTTGENTRTSLTKYLNKLQIFRERNSITDVQNASAIEVKFSGKNYIIYKDLFEKAIKLKGDVNAAMLGGVMSNLSWEDAAPSFTDPGNGGNLQTTGGIDWYIEARGVKDQVGTLGTVALGDMEDLNAQLIAAKSPKQHFQFCSNAVGTKFDNMLKALGSSGQIQSAQLSVDGRKIDFTTTSFTYGNFSYDRIYVPILDHPDLFTQTDIVKKAYYVPKGQVKVHGKGGGMVPRIQMRYWKSQVANNLGTDIIAEWHNGALAPTGPVGPEMVWDTYWATVQGLEMLGVEHCARQIVLS